MKNAKKIIFSLLAGATLATCAPAFADSYHHDRYDRYDHGRYYDRGHDYYRGYEHRPIIVERPYYEGRPVIVQQPYYGQPAPGLGIGALVGQALGSVYDYRH